jgi:2-deoxy-D-gluconate 3-dehydrogenase
MSAICYGLEDKVVLVTGGSRGIGLDLARALVEEQARLVICGRKQEGLDAAVETLGGGANLKAIQAHIAKEPDVESLFAQIKDSFGRLDVLINNVGMNLPAPGVAETEPGLWNKIVDSNLNGTFLCSRKAAELMKGQQKGKIVTVSSIAGQRAAPGMGIYGVAKAAMDMLTKVLAAELAPFNIQVNSIAPSMVKTDFSKPFWSNQDIHDAIVKTIPTGRLAETKDIVGPILFLASEAADFITGQVLNVDGGSTVI